jgi:hypothetical protein
VIDIIGRIAGMGIEAVGTGLKYGAKATAAVTRGVFFVFGKNVDMIETLKEIRSARETGTAPRRLEAPSEVIMPCGTDEVCDTEYNKVERVFTLIKLALEYSSLAYREKMLPVDQIVLVDRQAQIMAHALEQYLRKHKNAGVRKVHSAKVESLVVATSLFMKYHRSGNEQLFSDAVRMLEEIKD